MPRWAYSLLLRCAFPFAALAFLLRGWRNAAYRGSLRERLGLGLATHADRPLWLHAASVGEVQALAPLVASLHGEGLPLLVTVVTPTGHARARALFGDLPHVAIQAAPWDLPGAARRFLAAARPRAGVFVETELWPNLVAAAREAGVPLALVSARLSEKSLRRYRRWAARLMRDTVQSFAGIGAQSEADSARFLQLGARPAALSVMGNLKFDLPVPADIAARGEALRVRWAPTRPLWVAGSTHPGEEQSCLDAQRRLGEMARAQGWEPPLLALAPRRPERFLDVASWLMKQGAAFACSSQRQDAALAPVDVVLVDEMGALLAWYAAADAAFVGGSLVPAGGHNLLEPAVLGKPVLAGPHAQSAPEVARGLVEARGLTVVGDAGALVDMLVALLGNPEKARLQGARAAAAVVISRGATGRARALVGALPAA